VGKRGALNATAGRADREAEGALAVWHMARTPRPSQPRRSSTHRLVRLRGSLSSMIRVLCRWGKIGGATVKYEYHEFATRKQLHQNTVHCTLSIYCTNRSETSDPDQTVAIGLKRQISKNNRNSRRSSGLNFPFLRLLPAALGRTSVLCVAQFYHKWRGP
jgi:hypothetical protein